MSPGGWNEAQELQVGVDLIEAAKLQLAFLAEVHASSWLFDAQVLERTIERYEFCWLPLVASGERNVVPPLDCAWIWHCHKLNPVQYAADCEKLFGRLLDGNPYEKKSNEMFTKRLWEERYTNEPYHLDPRIHLGMRWFDHERKIVYDLKEAVLRQKSFYYQVCEPHYMNNDFLAAAVERYKGFLYILKQNNDKGKSEFCVPTYDVDLMWHTHQLHPDCYKEDTVRILGRILGHDDMDSDRTTGGKLDVGFSSIASSWLETFRFPYAKAGCMYRGEEPPAIPPQHQIIHGTLSSREDASGYWIQQQHAHLTTRQVMKVLVVVKLEASKDVSISSSLFFRLKAQQRNKAARIETRERQHSWSFECEAATSGLVLQVRSSRRFWWSKKRWSLVTTWEKLMKSKHHSISCQFPLKTKEGVLEIHAAVSATPPFKGPYLLRSVRARATDDSCQAITNSTTKRKHWITRTVLDHQNNEAYVIRAKFDKGTEIVNVHQGAWDYAAKPWKVPAAVVGDARKSTNSWSLLGGRGILSIIRGSSNQWNISPLFRVDCFTDCPIVLLSGRSLQFQVPGASEKEETGFVTVVRFSSDAPMGVATALFNWKSGTMQIDHDENVVLMLLLSTVISISMTQLLGKNFASLYKKQRHVRVNRNSDDWGSVVYASNLQMQAWWMQVAYFQLLSSASCGAGVCGVDTSRGGGCGGGCGAAAGCGGGCGGG